MKEFSAFEVIDYTLCLRVDSRSNTCSQHLVLLLQGDNREAGENSIPALPPQR